MDKKREIVDIIKTLKRAPPDHELQANNLFLPIDIDDYRLSIQASKNHHSTPQIDNLMATEYTNFEVALYSIGHKLPCFAQLQIHHHFKTWIATDYKNGMMIFAQMPYDKVNILYNILNQQKVFKLLLKKPTQTTNENYVVAFGNAFDGIELHGPFNDMETATEYAENIHKHSYDEWNIINVKPPE